MIKLNHQTSTIQLNDLLNDQRRPTEEGAVRPIRSATPASKSKLACPTRAALDLF